MKEVCADVGLVWMLEMAMLDEMPFHAVPPPKLLKYEMGRKERVLCSYAYLCTPDQVQRTSKVTQDGLCSRNAAYQ